jgi:hypothetical protein
MPSVPWKKQRDASVITRVVTLADGSSATQMDDFIITGAVVQAGMSIATTITDAQRVPSFVVAGGIFLTRSYTRLPDYFR